MDTPSLNISQEFFNPEGLISRLPEVTKTLRDFTQNYLENRFKQFPQLSGKWAQKNLVEIPYGNARELRVYIPVGLNTTYLEYLSTLTEAVDITTRLVDDVLAPFDRWISMRLSDPSSLNSLRNASDLRQFKSHNLDVINAKLADHFQTQGISNTTRYKNVFKRHADYLTTMEVTNELNVKFFANDRKKLMGLVENINTNLDKLYDRVQEHTTEYTVSDKSLKILSELCFTMAREVEFYSVVGYRLSAVVHALEETEEFLKKATKKLPKTA